MRQDSIQPRHHDPDLAGDLALWAAERAESEAREAEERQAEREEVDAMLAEGRARDAERLARAWQEQRAAEAAAAAAQAEQQRRHDEAAERRQAQARYVVPFLRTSVARIVASTIERSITHGWNSLVIGAAGVGKTYALREAVRRWQAGEGPEVALLTVTAAIGASTREVLCEIGPLLGVDPVTDVVRMERRIPKHISRYPVVLFDEAQNLGLKQLRTLLTVSEEAGVQMVFCGNGEVLKLVASKQAAIQQVSRRIPFREEIGCIVEADVNLIASHFGVEGMDAWRVCYAIGAHFHADGVAKVLSLARDRSKGAKVIHLAAIREALVLMPHFAMALETERAPKRAQRRTTLGPA